MSLWRSMRRYAVPSRTIGRYLGRLYMARFLGLLLGLVAILQMLDLLATRDDIMAAAGADASSIWLYLSLRTPQLISQFIPFSALLATLLALAALSQNSEIIVMKAAGLSAQRILLPLGLVSVVIAIFHFAFNEAYVAQSTAQLAYWQENNYAVNLGPPPEYSTHKRLVDGNTLVLTKAVTRNSNTIIVDGVSIYHRDEQGNLVGLTHANFAAYVRGHWTLFEVRHFDPLDHSMTTAESEPWDTNIPPRRFLEATVRPNQVSFLTLWRAIVRLRDEGVSVGGLMASLFHKFTGPASTLLMPLLGAIAGFGIHRAGSLLFRIVMGMFLGFAFFVADNFMLAMGQFGVAPPLLAAGAPVLLFFSLGFAVLLYSEE